MEKIPYLVFILMMFLVSVMSISAENPSDFTLKRQRMVKEQIIARGVKDKRVLEAMLKVPRHLFVPETHRYLAYEDYPLDIGENQTISQPYIVAYMTEALNLKPEDRVLEIGTGSGYQAAILAELVKEVYTIELFPLLGKRAKKLLKELHYDNITVKIGNGFKGLAEKAPFDAVIVTCAPSSIPPVLVEQLNEGGRMIIPVGRVGSVQKLVLGVKKNGRFKTRDLLPVRFVPMLNGTK